MTDQPAFEYRDTDGARLRATAVEASTYYGGEPVVALLTDHPDGDDLPVVYIPLDRVEEVVAGIRAAAGQPDHLPPSEQQLAEITAAIAAYEQHPNLGFACCSAHAVADAAPVLLAELRRAHARITAIAELCDQQELAARAFEAPLPEWVTVVRDAAGLAAASHAPAAPATARVGVSPASEASQGHRGAETAPQSRTGIPEVTGVPQAPAPAPEAPDPHTTPDSAPQGRTGGQDGASETSLASKATPKADSKAETVHGCPPDGSGLTPCCGKTPFELPLSDRISSEAPTTCPGVVPASVTLADQYTAAGNEMAASLARDGFSADEITDMLADPNPRAHGPQAPTTTEEQP